MELDNLESIFNARIFRLPDYQRGYSWGEPQLRDLWRDIQILGEDKSHYTGVLSVVDKENDETHVGEITQMIFGYEEDNPSHVYFKTKILGLSDTNSGVPERTLYTNNLQRAKDFFDEKVRGMTVEQLEELFTKVTKNLRFNGYKFDDELNEFVSFEAMNNRGKPLSSLELLKNRLIYLSTLLPDNDDEEKQKLRTDINNVWKTVYEFLGKIPITTCTIPMIVTILSRLKSGCQSWIA